MAATATVRVGMRYKEMLADFRIPVGLPGSVAGGAEGVAPLLTGSVVKILASRGERGVEIPAALWGTIGIAVVLLGAIEELNRVDDVVILSDSAVVT